MGGGRVAPDLPPESIQPEQPATRPGRGNRVAPASVPSTEDSSSRPGGGPSAAPSSRPPSARPVQAAWEPSAAEKRLEAHGEVYIPFRAAKAKVAEVQADMEAMKHQHMQIVNELEGHYKEIEQDLQDYFLNHIKKLTASGDEKEKRGKEILARVNAEANQYREMAQEALLEATTSNQELAERIHVLESELENQGRGVNVLSEQHASQLADVNAAHDAELRELREQHASAVASTQQQHTEELAGVRETLGAEIEGMREQHAAEVEELNQRLQAASCELQDKVAALQVQVQDLTQSLTDARARNRRNEEEVKGHAEMVGEVVALQTQEAAEMEAEIAAWIEETLELKRRKLELEEEVARLAEGKATAENDKEAMRVSMEDGGRQMQDDMERIREELAAAEDRNRMLAEQVEALKGEVEILTDEKATAEGVGQRLAMSVEKLEQEAEGEGGRTREALLRALEPLESYAKTLAALLLPTVSTVRISEGATGEDAAEVAEEEVKREEGGRVGGEGTEGGEAEGGEARKRARRRVKARREGEAAGEKLRRIEEVRATLEGEEARLKWPESPQTAGERAAVAGQVASIPVEPVVMEEEEEATFEAEKAAKEGGEEKQAEGGVEEEGEEKMEERVEGEEKKEAGEVKEEEGEVKEEEGEEGGEKKKDGEEGGETERERETEEVQSKGGGLPVEEEAVYEGLEGGGEEEAKAKRIVHVDMVGDATVREAGDRIAEEIKRVCDMLLGVSAKLAKQAKASSEVQSESAITLEDIMESVGVSISDVDAVVKSMEEMEKGGAFMTSSLIQQKAASKVLQMAKGSAEEEAFSAQAKSAASALTKNREKILAKKKQVQMAAAKLREDFAAIDENQEHMEEMDEEERTEYVKIRKREFDLMEKRLKQKDEELTQHMEANKKMELVLAASADGQALSAEEAQELIERHATELDDLREESGHRISKLQAEISQLRETLDTDQEALQDTIDELREQVDDNENKLILAYDKIQELSDQLKAVEEGAMATEEQLRKEVYEANERFVRIDLEYKARQAKKVEEDGAEAEEEMAFMQEQVRLAKAALKEVESRDKEEAQSSGVGKMKRSATAKNAFWELQKVEQDLDKRKEEVEQTKQELDRLRREEAEMAAEFEKKQKKAKEEAERAQKERLERLETQFEARREKLKAQEEERELLAQKKAEEAAAVAAINAQHQQQAGDHLLDQLKDEMRGGAGGAVGPMGANRAKAKAMAQRQQKEKQLAAMNASGDAKKLKEAEKKIRQMEANEKKLETKIHKLEDEVAKGGPAKGGGAGAGAKKETPSKGVAGGGGGGAKAAELEKEVKKLGKDLEKMEKELTKAKEAAEQGAAWKKQLDGMQKDMKELKALNAELEVLYKKEQGLRKKYYNQIEDMKGKIRVYARCRPFAGYEKEKQCKQCVTFIDDVNCKVDCGKKGVKDFTFDEVFRMDSKQETIFEGVSYLVQSAVDGFNVCIFAYGQTGSGKTFTMYGKRDDESLWGIAPRAMKELYEIIDREKETYDINVTCNMLELYNDQLVDLLPDRDKKGNLINAPTKMDIKLDARGIVQVQGATQRGPCHSFDQLYQWNEYGNAHRHTASTAMNAESSRSHLVFSVIVESKNRATGAATLGKLTLVDLAGSERQSKTNATGDRLKEAKSINISLSALGNVISALSTGEKFVPYRDNLLTRLLQDGLGGNAKTLMFVNISPADYNADETASSLTYAARVKLIVNDASKAAESAEVQRLKKIIGLLKKGVDPEEAEKQALKDDGFAPKVQEAMVEEEAEDEAKADNEEIDDSRWMEGPDFEREEIAAAEREAAEKAAAEGGGELVEEEAGAAGEGDGLVEASADE